MKKKMITKVIFRYHQPFMTGGILMAQPEKSFFLYAFFNQIQPLFNCIDITFYPYACKII